jgi:RNA polymerase sigma-70 factor (ECF subfamily)
MGCGSFESDDARFAKLFRDHGDAIYRFCLRRTHDCEQAQDACSTVFVEAWRRRMEVDLFGRPPRPWLYGVATNVIRNQARSSRRRADLLRRVPGARADFDCVEEIAERLDAAARTAVVLEVMKRLSPGERAVVVLCLVDGCSYEAAARKLDVPVGTVRSRLFRARGRLRLLAGEASMLGA